MADRNWIDNLVAAVNPKAAVERERARVRLELLRGYDGAKAGRRTDGWFTAASASANSEIKSAAPKLRERSRDLIRNDAWASKAAQVIVSNTVGAGIIGQPKAGRSRRRADSAAALWQSWAESTECDADGRHNLYGLQGLALRTVVESGEVLIRRRRRRPVDGLSVPLQLQLLEPEFLDTTKDGVVQGGGRIIQGIEFDAIGRRVAYWLYSQHPGEVQTDAAVSSSGLTSARVPAEDIAHCYRCERPGQVRGVPWSSAVLLPLKDLADYESAQLLKQKLAACFTAFVVDTEPPELSLGGVELAESLEPGAIEVLPPGRDVRFANPPSADGYELYVKQILHKIAAGFGITYEALTGDLNEVNFSSGRMGWLEFYRNIETWRWQLLIPMVCDPIWRWFVEAAGAGLARNPLADVSVVWTPPRREMIDPTKEIGATRDAIRAGLKTWSEAVRELGEDPESVMQELAQDFGRMDELGLVLDSDPRKDPNRVSSSQQNTQPG